MPSFVIIGAQRAGTTSLYAWLCEHPRVRSAFKKEVHYFDLRYDRGQRWYRSHFPLERRERVVSGENTPYLLFHPLAPQRVASTLPDDTLLVALLRDPTERAISHYWLERRNGVETEDLATAIALETARLSSEWRRVENGEYSFAHHHFSYVARGEYAAQLRRWFEVVGRERIMILESEDLQRSAATRSRLLERLGLESHALPFPSLNSVVRADDPGSEVRGSLRDRYAPLNQDLFELIGEELWIPR